MYIFLSEVRLEEKEGHKNYLGKTSECFDTYEGRYYKINNKYEWSKRTKAPKLVAETFHVYSFVVLFFSRVAILNFDSLLFIKLIC